VIIKPSKKVLFSAVFLSLVLHGFVCKLPVQSAIIEEQVNKRINISLLSLAAPTVNAKKVEKEIVKKSLKKAEKPKEVKKQVASVKSSNNKGTRKSTVTPVLNHNDFVKTVAPTYPSSAIRRGIQGSVMVKVKIGFNGKPKLVTVSKSSGFKSLDSSARNAVSKWDFKKSALSKSYNSWVFVPVNFVIQ